MNTIQQLFDKGVLKIRRAGWNPRSYLDLHESIDLDGTRILGNVAALHDPDIWMERHEVFIGVIREVTDDEPVWERWVAPVDERVDEEMVKEAQLGKLRSKKGGLFFGEPSWVVEVENGRCIGSLVFNKSLDEYVLVLLDGVVLTQEQVKELDIHFQFVKLDRKASIAKRRAKEEESPDVDGLLETNAGLVRRLREAEAKVLECESRIQDMKEQFSDEMRVLNKAFLGKRRSKGGKKP